MGDAVHQAHIEAILGKRSTGLAQPAAFYDRFGSTELGWGLMVQQRTLTGTPADRRVGTPDPLAEVAVLRRDGTPADANEIGLLGAKSPTITAGYWNDSDTTCRSRLAGYWLTGDMAYRDEDGTFFHVDRAVDVIETSSGPCYSVLMEELLLDHVPAIADCAVVAASHAGQRVPVAVVTSRTDAVDPVQLLHGANAVLRSAGHPPLARVEVAGSATELPGSATGLPLGVTGKVLKRALRDRYGSL
jgi:acyl-coenzyme A synthetase/AMP-(fatty) acid ligase